MESVGPLSHSMGSDDRPDSRPFATTGFDNGEHADAPEQAARKRRRLVAACLALLLEEEGDAHDRKVSDREFGLYKSLYEEEHGVLAATIQERLHSVPAANDEMYELEHHRLKRFAHGGMALAAGMETQKVKQLKTKKQWQKPRSQAWWEECSDPSFPQDEFQRMFRVGRDTFCLICDRVSCVLSRQNTRIRACVPVQQRVASGVLSRPSPQAASPAAPEPLGPGL